MERDGYAPAPARAANRGDHRHRNRHDGLPGGVFGPVVALGLAAHSAFLELRDVAASGERKVAGTAKHDRAEIWFGGGDGAGIGHGVIHRRRHRVASVGVVDRDGGDRSDPLVAEENGVDRGVDAGHGRSLAARPVQVGQRQRVAAGRSPVEAPVVLCWPRPEPLARFRRMPTVFDNPNALLAAVGTDLGASEWITIEQDRIDAFADATGDYQWIHVDPVKAAEGPFGAPIAHGYLTLSLTNQFLPEIVRVDNVSMGINYGVNKVRFPQPVVVGSKVRGTAVLADAQEINGGVQATITITVEIEGADKPACIVESVSRFLR